MNKLLLSAIIIITTCLTSACTPGPLNAKRYQPYTGNDAAVVYTQVNERHPGLYYLQRFFKKGDCYEEAELIYISNNFMDGKTNRLIESKIQPNQYWALFIMDNSSGRQMIMSTAFIPESGKHYVAVSYLGAVEVPQDMQFSTSDNLEKVFDKYKDRRAKFWNIRSGKCKSFF